MEFFQKIYSLGLAGDWLNGSPLDKTLKQACCIEEIKVMQEAAATGVAALREPTCAEQAFQEHVAAVFDAIEKALSKGAQQANSRDAEDCAHVMGHLSKYRSESEPDMRMRYERLRPFFMIDAAICMQIIREAATGALESIAVSQQQQPGFPETQAS